tara:strand:+ start:271 stop:690 length:420 start_codon:yes stop_codon:yes gene_type:complete
MNSIESESLNDNRNQTARSGKILNSLRNQAKKLGWIEVTKNVYKTNNNNHIHLTGFNEKTKEYFFENKDDIPSPEDFDEMNLLEQKNNGLFVVEKEKADKKKKKSSKKKSTKRKRRKSLKKKSTKRKRRKSSKKRKKSK